jgi:hypothetical protein
LRDRMLRLREGCEDGDRRGCVRLEIIIGENRERRAAWWREVVDQYDRLRGLAPTPCADKRSSSRPSVATYRRSQPRRLRGHTDRL